MTLILGAVSASFGNRAGIVQNAGATQLALSLDLTSSLDSRITFARAGTRNYITGGVPTLLASGQPAFESWGGVNRGLSIDPAFTNLIKFSEDMTQTSVWTYSGTSTVVTGDAGPGIITNFQNMVATATTNTHMIRQKPGSQTA